MFAASAAESALSRCHANASVASSASSSAESSIAPKRHRATEKTQILRVPVVAVVIRVEMYIIFVMSNERATVGTNARLHHRQTLLRMRHMFRLQPSREKARLSRSWYQWCQNHLLLRCHIGVVIEYRRICLLLSTKQTTKCKDTQHLRTAIIVRHCCVCFCVICFDSSRPRRLGFHPIRSIGGVDIVCCRWYHIDVGVGIAGRRRRHVGIATGVGVGIGIHLRGTAVGVSVGLSEFMGFFMSPCVVLKLFGRCVLKVKKTNK